MSEDRPPVAKPFTPSIQAQYRPGAGWYQFPGRDVTIGPQPEDAAGCCDRGGTLREHGRFAEALASFDRAIALKPDYAEAYNGRGIVLASLSRVADAIASFDRAIALKPNYAEAHNNRGLVLQDLKRLDEALVGFDAAIALKPDSAGIYNNRGVVLANRVRFDDALASYDRAIALKADYAQAHYNRGIALQEIRRFDEARAAFDRAIALKPDYAQAYNNRGALLQGMRRLDEALADFDKAISLRADFAEAYCNRSYCLLQMGRFAEGWRLHEWRNKVEQPVARRSFLQPLWLGAENISGATLFVHCEQGLGDTIQFCRYGKLLKARGADVVMSVQEPLHRLLRQAEPGIRIVRQDEVPSAFDFHCPMMSLPLAFGTTLETIPSERRYIASDESQRQAWNARLPPPTKPRIGLVWSGNAKQKNDHNRSVGLPALAPLFSVDAHWIALQKEFRQDDAGPLQERPQIVCFGDELKDLSDTAAVIDLVDLVITVDTGVAHLAGAMGKPTWILLSFNADWRWLLDRDDSPWYPTARLFRQDRLAAWESVVTRVHEALAEFVRSRA